jgi:hypothetical protein
MDGTRNRHGKENVEDNDEEADEFLFNIYLI